MIFGWLALGQAKPVRTINIPCRRFFGDGYGFIQQLFGDAFYKSESTTYLLALLAFLCVAKGCRTCLTIGSGGSGGIIAPALFLARWSVDFSPLFSARPGSCRQRSRKFTRWWNGRGASPRSCMRLLQRF